MVEHAGIASAFLADVFGCSTAEPVYISSLPNDDARGREPGERHVVTREMANIEAFTRKWDRKDRALYFCTATIKSGSTRRSKETIAELNALFADIDFKSITASPEEVEAKLRELFCRPSKIVHSGNGLHAYWLLKEALPATPENVASFEAQLRLLADHVGGDLACAEASRLMRLPGTHNTKNGAWIEVRLVEECPLRYEFSDLAEWLEMTSPVIRRKTGNGKTPEEINPWLAVAERFGNKPPIDVEARLAAMRYQGKGDSSIHSTQVSVSAALLNRGLAVDEVVDVVVNATRAAAGDFGQRWNWRREERVVRGMCETWLAKHPEIVEAEASEAGEAEAKLNGGEQRLPLLRPYVARPFAEIPLRQWLHEKHYIRQQVVMTVAPGGYGKTSLILCNALEMCTREGLIGAPPAEGPLRVAYWNAEDPEEEVERRIAAICVHYAIDPGRLRDQLFLGSKISDGRRLASLDRSGNVAFNDKLLAEATQFVVEQRIDCVMFDPLIAFHRAPEADNVAMEQVIKAFEQIAVTANCCVELAQHTRKQSQQSELTADDSRGAGAIVNAARSVRVLNRMTKEEAELPGIASEERRHYVRVARDKTNLAPPGKATWIHLVSVDLPNSDGTRPGDKVQAVEAWDYPQPFENVTPSDMRWARAEVGRKAYRTRPESPDWFGYALAKHLKLDIGLHGAPREPLQRGNRKRVTAIINTWVEKRVLAKEKRRDEGDRKDFEFFNPGSWDDEADVDC